MNAAAIDRPAAPVAAAVPAPPRAARALVACAIAGGLAWLVAGVPAAARPFDSHDFRHSWAGTRAVLLGLDPYEDATLRRIWMQDPVPGPVPGTPNYRFLNPPGYAVLLAPFAMLPFETAARAFAAVSLLAYAAGIWGIGRTIARGWPRWARAAGAIAAGSAAPVWFAVQAGQASLLVFGMLALAFAALERDRDGAAGVLVGLAAVKFTMGLLLIPYLAWRRRWRALGATVAVAGGLTAMALASIGPGALGSYLRAVRESQGPGGVNWAFGPATGTDLSIHPLAARIATPARPQLAAALSELALLGIALALWRVVRARRGVSALEVAAVLVASQLVVYHRAYDAVVAVFAGAALLGSPALRRSRAAVALAAGSLFVVANAHAPLARGAGRFAWVWDVVVLSHRTWALCALFALVCWAALREAAVERAAITLDVEVEQTAARRSA